MHNLDVYLRLKTALSIADIEEARKAYIELGTVENALDCMEMACKDNEGGKAVVEFLKGTMKYSKDTPIELQHINFPKVEDQIEHQHKVKIFTPKKGLTGCVEEGKIN